MQKPLLHSSSHLEVFKNIALKKTKKPFLGIQVGCFQQELQFEAVCQVTIYRKDL